MDANDLAQKTELESPEEQAEIASLNAEQRQQELLARQKQAQLEEGGRGGLSQRLKQSGQVALDIAKEQIKKQAKRQVKKVVLQWLIGVLVAIFGNPITWIVLIAIVVIALAYACVSDASQCIQIIGLEGVIDIVGKL
ncbi:MAG: hypothetical protein V1712_01910 [Patescibacteria group bacterium]